jgi:translation initiation factor 2 beta subunit (eIF-2beta)/eIF-5
MHEEQTVDIDQVGNQFIDIVGSEIKEQAKDRNNYDEKFDTVMRTMIGNTYDELLSCCLEQIKNIGLCKTVTKIRPVTVKYENKKTHIYNFSYFYVPINRDREHVLKYILDELNVTGSIKDNDSVLLNGRYTTNQILSLLKTYRTIYIVCKTCKNDSTKLEKDPVTRLLYICCDSCKSKNCIVKK